CKYEECQKCFDASFASSPKAKFWSSTNGGHPRDFFKSSNKLCCFECEVCNHKFDVRLTKITNMNSWCPYCAGKVCEDQECEVCLQRSFASNPKSKFWLSKNILNPRQVSRCSQQKFWFW